MYSKRKPSPRNAFTIVELLVVIAIVAILILLLLPAINALRESARRNGCIAQTAQIILAINNYENTHEYYPAGVTEPSGGPIISQPVGQHHGWLIEILPHIEELNLYRRVDMTTSVYARNNIVARSIRPQFLVCPSSALVLDSDFGRTCYAGVHHDVEAPIDVTNNGVFFLNTKVRRREIRDGTSHTLFVGEIADFPNDLSWMSGTRASLRNTGTPLNMTGPSPSAGTVLTDAMIDSFEADQRRTRSRFTDYDSDWLEDDAVNGDSSFESQPAEIEANDEGMEQVVEQDVEDSNDNDSTSISDEPKNRSRATLNAIQKKLYVGGFGSDHTARGATFGFGDGHVRFLSNSIDPKVLQQLGNRHDGTSISDEDIR